MRKMDARIKEERTAEVTLLITTEDDHPLAEREVEIAQTKHRFLFGSNGFFLLPLANNELTGAEKERTAQIAEHFLALMNYVTLPFYWGRFEPEPGKPDTERLRQTAKWCVEHGLQVKGHPLCWHTLTAPWLLQLTNEEIIAAQLGRIRRDVSAFAGLIDCWDVVNEAVIMPNFNKYDNGITRICKELGRIKTIKLMFEAARQTNPQAVLLLNDFDVSPAYEILIEGCLAAGVQIDVIGIQSHMHQGYWGVEKTEQILERFARFNLPLHFTETTLVSGALMPPEYEDLNDYQVTDWPSTQEGEERQARETVLHYKTLLAHPLVTGITWWDLLDGQWLNAPGGLLRKDGSPKPAYEELHKLVKGEWWLAPTVFRTDREGKVKFRGFLGDYELRYAGRRLPFQLEEKGEVTLKLKL
ncbi:MAG: 1,4-beta-xylanase [Firmicutes bacterium]|nr:1,4-beta-xylanase [Bacillota bacterium]